MKKKIERTIILFLALIGLYHVTTCSIMLYPETKEEKIIKYSGPITQDELASFLPLWREFFSKYADKTDFSSISFTQNLPSDVLPFNMKLWLRSKGWETNRFFFVEQRLRDIINYINMKRHAKDVISIMNEALDKEKNASTRENIKNVIATQQNVLDEQKSNAQEIALVEKHMNDIINVIGK